MHRPRRFAAAAVAALVLTGCGLLPSAAPVPSVDDPALETVIGAASGSVAKVLATRCGAAPLPGSAFVVGPRLLLTASHVVAGTRQVAIALPGAKVALADVVGLDPSADTALLRTRTDLPAAGLSLLADAPAVGSAFALLGYPFGGDGLASAQALATSTTDQVVVNGFDMSRLLTLDVEVASGNSGGPVLDDSGAVAGMVVARMGGKTWRDHSAQVTVAIPAQVLSEHLAGWTDAQTSLAEPCSGEADTAQPAPQLDDQADAGEPGLTVWLLGAGLNAGQYPSSWQLFTPAARLALGSFEEWQQSVSGTTWRSLRVDSATAEADRVSLAATVERLSGQTCSLLELDYQLRRLDGIWLIDQASERAAGSC